MAAVVAAASNPFGVSSLGMPQPSPFGAGTGRLPAQRSFALTLRRDWASSAAGLAVDALVERLAAAAPAASEVETRRRERVSRMRRAKGTGRSTLTRGFGLVLRNVSQRDAVPLPPPPPAKEAAQPMESTLPLEVPEDMAAEPDFPEADIDIDDTVVPASPTNEIDESAEEEHNGETAHAAVTFAPGTGSLSTLLAASDAVAEQEKKKSKASNKPKFFREAAAQRQSLAELRRSSRRRMAPLEYWRGETKTYERKYMSLPTVKDVHTEEEDSPMWHPAYRAKKKARIAKEEAKDAKKNGKVKGRKPQDPAKVTVAAAGAGASTPTPGINIVSPIQAAHDAMNAHGAGASPSPLPAKRFSFSPAAAAAATPGITPRLQGMKTKKRTSPEGGISDWDDDA